MIIDQASHVDLNEIFSLLQKCRARLIEQNILQWDSEYPSIDHIESDILRGSLRKLTINGNIAGVISFDEFQEWQYSGVAWQINLEPIAVIHRLAVIPEYQGNGLATELMNYAELTIAELQYGAIRLDVYSGNQHVAEFYTRRGYKRVGEVYFPRRELPFICMERPAKI